MVRGANGYERDREILLRKAKDWRKLAVGKELEIRPAAKTTQAQMERACLFSRAYPTQSWAKNNSVLP